MMDCEGQVVTGTPTWAGLARRAPSGTTGSFATSRGAPARGDCGLFGRYNAPLGNWRGFLCAVVLTSTPTRTRLHSLRSNVGVCNDTLAIQPSRPARQRTHL